MWRNLAPLAAVVVLAACTDYVDRYEEHVYDREPLYCYDTIGEVQCYREPFHRDDRRLVNYFGPHPSRYDPPAPPRRAPLQPPPATADWVMDPEPVVKPATPLTYQDIYPGTTTNEGPAPDRQGESGEITAGTTALIGAVEGQRMASAQPFRLTPSRRLVATETASNETAAPPPRRRAARTRKPFPEQPAPDAVPVKPVYLAAPETASN